MKNLKTRPRFEVVRDKNLYGRKFFSGSLFFLVFGIVIQYFVYFLKIPQYLIVYVPLYFVAILLFSAPFAKNLKEFHPMSLWLAFLMLYTSVFAKAFVLFVPFPDLTIAFLAWLPVMILSELAFLISLITIVIVSQRVSLRTQIGLLDKLFDDGKGIWKKELKGFPNLDKIVENLDEGRFIANLFEKGYFNLTVLWSCNVMEKTVNSVRDGLVSETPDKTKLFVDEKGEPLRFSKQLRNLGFNDKNYELNFDKLWHKVRNDIAHRNYKPTYNETQEAIKTVVIFTREMPKILHNQVSF